MQSLHLVIGYTTVSSLQIEHGLVLIMAGSDAAEMHGPAFGCGGHGEPVFFVLVIVFSVLAFVLFVPAFVSKTTVGAPVDSVIAFGWPSFINPGILGRQMSPVILGREPGDNGQARRARLTWKTTRLESKCL